MTATSFTESTTRAALTNHLTEHPPTLTLFTSQGNHSSLQPFAKQQLDNNQHFIVTLQDTPNNDWLSLARDPQTTMLQAFPVTIITNSQTIANTITRADYQPISDTGEWTYAFATTLTQSMHDHRQYYPEIASGPGGEQPAEPEADLAESWTKCDGCRWRARPCTQQNCGRMQVPTRCTNRVELSRMHFTQS